MNDHRPFVDALREVLGLDPLYCEPKPTGTATERLNETALRAFDEPERAPLVDQEIRRHGGWFIEQRRRGGGLKRGATLPRYATRESL